MLRLALYQPDIPQNTGTIIRLSACLGLAVDIVEPAGFPWSDRSLRRAGMDYLDHAEVRRHLGYREFAAACRGAGRRIVLMTTGADTAYVDFAFAPTDVILLGSEGAGVPASVHDDVDARLCVPMRPGLRSLNVAVTAAMVAGEAMRQTCWLSAGAG